MSETHSQNKQMNRIQMLPMIPVFDEMIIHICSVLNKYEKFDNKSRSSAPAVHYSQSTYAARMLMTVTAQI